MVKWISQQSSELLFQVRVLAGAHKARVVTKVVLRYRASGYGLVVERVLAKDETGVRFSLAAHKRRKTWTSPGFALYVSRSDVWLASRTARRGRENSELASYYL